jgi:hypothetical protein
VENKGGSVLLDNCTLEFMDYGVHVNDEGEATLRNGCVIDQFSRAGVLVNFGEVDISDTFMRSDATAGGQGLAARGSKITVTDTQIGDVRNEGIEMAEEASGTVTDCTIWNSTVGIRMSGSTAEIEGTEIFDCLDGINLFQSTPNITGCLLYDNFNGVSSKDCAPGYSLKDCTIGRNSQYGVYAIGNGTSESGTSWTFEGEENKITRLIQWWMLDVSVTDTDAIPIPNTNVIVRFNNGTRVIEESTDALGIVRDIELEGHRIENDGTTSTQEKYLVHVQRGERWAEHKVTMDKNKGITVQLGEVPTITESPWFLAIPVIVALIIIIVVGYWWFRIR